MNNFLEQLNDEIQKEYHKKKQEVIEKMLNSCTIATRDEDGELLPLDTLKRHMQIIGCELEIRNTGIYENITLLINGVEEQVYQMFADCWGDKVKIICVKLL